MKKVLSFVLAAGLALGVAATASAEMDCPSGVYDSKGFCDEYNVDATEARLMLEADENVIILDVRTIAEWAWVGHPGTNKAGEGADIAAQVVNISSHVCQAPALIVNPAFMSDVNEAFGDIKEDVTLITMCRSGSRSRAAAKMLYDAGYNVLNMNKGFEGGSDEYGYRTKTQGWKNTGNPYVATPVDGYME